MGKGALVVNMPESCSDCKFCRGFNVCKLKKYLNGDILTTIYSVDKQIFDKTRPSWCPLIPLTEYSPIPQESSKICTVKRCMYCGALLPEHGGGYPEDYGLHTPYINFADKEVCPTCDLVVTSTDRMIKKIIDTDGDDRAIKELQEHVEEIRRYYKDKHIKEESP